MNAPDDYSDLAIIWRLLRQVRRFWPHIIGIFLLGLLAAPLALLTPVPLALAVDSLLRGQPPPEILQPLLPASVADSADALLIFAAVLVVLVALLTQLQTIGSTLLRTYTGEKISLDFRTALFRHVQQLSLTYHDVIGTADSVYRIQYDTEAIRYLAIDGITPFVSAGFTLFAMLFVMFRIDWQLALIALAISPILFLVARTYRLNLRRKSRHVRRTEKGALSIVQEVLTSLRVVKAFGQEDREQLRFEEQSTKGVRARMRLAVAEGSVGFILGMTTAIGTALVLYVGVRHVQNGTITLGQLLLVMGYLAQLYTPLKTISRKTASLQSHLVKAERAFALLDAPPGLPEHPNPRPVQRLKGEVIFKHVSFAYQLHQPVLQNVTFAVAAGTRLGIIGKTGAGKTTLVGLLARFFDATGGRILLDGVDLRLYRLSDLRDQFAIVLQDTVLFSTTIAENIAYARAGATMGEITAAAKAANAHEFISVLPDGYETMVGERGMLLSGGERQRIALARAFLKDAPILILDEPTSSVDIETEEGILEAMERLMEGRTTFMIAHRLTTLLNSDLIMTLKDGRLVSLRTDVREAVRLALSVDDLVDRQEEQTIVDQTRSPSVPDLERPTLETVSTSVRRGRPLVIDWQENAEELELMCQREMDPYLRTRLHALLLIRQGHSLIDVSNSLPVGYRTLQRWVGWYRNGGLDEVLRRTPNQVGNGPPPLPEVLTQLPSKTAANEKHPD